jgi:hypothetical protein
MWPAKRNTVLFKLCSLSALLFSSLYTLQIAKAAKYNLSTTLGLPLMKADLGSGFTPNLEAKAYIDLELSRVIGQLPLSLGVFFQGFFLSKFGNLPLSNNGLVFTYFPFGAPISRVNQTSSENGDLSTQKIAAFIKLKTGLTFINLHEKGGSNIQIGSSGIGYQVSAGVEFPLQWGLTLGPQLGYSTTLFTKDYRDNLISISGYHFGATVSLRMD